MSDLTICIPARNEMFLARTIQDILENIEADTEIIAVLDGAWADPPVEDHPRVTLVYLPNSVGQRAATNMAVRMATSKYVMKADAHCAFGKGFDRILMEDMEDDITMLPLMKNLHAFDLICPDCGWRRYQGPLPRNIEGKVECPECKGKKIDQDVVWIAKKSPNSTAYCFDSEPHFQYMNDFKKRPAGQGPLSESMSIQGSCFMMTRERYLDLNVCDEEWGSWGSQGIEVACKSWLSGGRVIVNHKTWYAHMFRTQGAEFGFPYPLGGRQVENAKKYARDLFFNNKWERQVYPLSWLLQRFWPVPGWTEAQLKEAVKVGESFKPAKVHAILPPKIVRSTPLKGVVYYTDNRLAEPVMQACQSQLLKSVNGHKIVSVSLQPIDFGANIHVDKERGYLTMFEQILAGLEESDADIIYLAEHDILYSESHFNFMPPRTDTYYYDQNIWKVDYETGRALFYFCKQTLSLCAYRDLLLEHYRERVRRTEAAMKSMGGHEFGNFIRRQGFEPGSHHRSERVDDYPSDVWMSEFPSIDIRHGQNLTPSRWRQDQFRDQRNCRGWTEAEELPYWGNTKALMEDIKNGNC